MSTINDRLILNSIFNPCHPFDEDVSWTTENSGVDHDRNDDLPIDPVAVQLEADGIKAAEAKDFDEATKIFTNYIQLFPKNASGYNNRAQVCRLKGDLQGAENDLNAALSLCNERGPVAKQAFAQRAVLRERKGDEEGARKDYTAATALGNAFAKQQMIRLNPTAALCNKMLTEMFQKYKSTKQDCPEPKNNADGSK